MTVFGERFDVAPAVPASAAIATARVSPSWLGAAAVACAATAAWSATRIDLARVDDLGLAPTLSVWYWVALVGLNAIFFAALRRREISTPTMIVLLGALIVTLFGVASIASSLPRTEPVWRHLGIVDHLSRTGRIDGTIDAYFNWPGFFTLSEAIVALTGVRSLLAVARWAPVWFNVLWVAAASVPMRMLTRDRRRMWLGLWVFCLLNWIDQDYYSPQAFALFLYLVVIGVVLSFLRADPGGRLAVYRREAASTTRGVRSWWRSRSPVAGVSAGQRSGAVGVTVLCGVAVLVSHQLTPIVLIVVLATLVAVGRLWATRLPFILVTALLVWLTTAASAYLVGHPVLSFGELEESAGANVARRLNGSPGHLFVVRERMVLFLFMFGAAVLGALRRRRRRDDPDAGFVLTIVLAVAPFALVPAHSYGGEMLLRATLFALPFMAVLISDAVPLPGGSFAATRPLIRLSALMRSAFIILLCATAAAASVFARYGNARFDMFTNDEVAAVQEMYRLAPANGVLVSAAHPTPWRDQRYDDFSHTTFMEVCRSVPGPAGCAAAVIGRIHQGRHGGMVLVLRSGEESLRMQGVMTTAELAVVEAALRAQPDAELVYENPDARLYAFGVP